MAEPDDAARHRAKMEKRKQMQDAEAAARTREQGLLMVHTGTGKGKSTAAFGLALRMLGYGRRVGVVQLIKGAWDTGARSALGRFAPLVTSHTLGGGFPWTPQDKARDIASCRRAWDQALALMQEPGLALLVLD